MPRNKSLIKHHNGRSSGGGGARGGGGSNSTAQQRAKIVIKPFSKPPSLPPDYYDKTVQELLQGTLQVLQCSRGQSGGAAGSGSSSSVANHFLPSNVQNLYQAVVHLVSHQYGTRLYADLYKSMKEACQIILPASAADNNSNKDGWLLHYVPQQYQLYLDYLSLVKHIFLPLDRSHLWNATAHQAIKIGASAATLPPAAPAPAAAATTNHSSSSSATTTTTYHRFLTIWETGLQQFGTRLRELGWEEQLYQEWLQAFLNDWNNATPTSSPPSIINFNTPSLLSSSYNMNNNNNYDIANIRPQLQYVWYLWQDVRVLPHLPLQHDLEEYWKARSKEWMTMTDPYPAAHFLHYAHAKYVHAMTAWQPWLPSLWLCSVLEHCLLMPHFLPHSSLSSYNNTSNSYAVNNSNSRTINNTNDFLLNPKYLYPILQEEIHSTATPASAAAVAAATARTTAAASAFSSSHHHHAPAPIPTLTCPNLTTVQQLWMLASRLPHNNGPQHVAIAINGFVKQQGLQLVERKTISPVQMIADLLEFQDSLHTLLQSLPLGSTELLLPLLKSTWEEVVNVERFPEPSIAECLAKFLDQILRNNKKMEQYAQQYAAAAQQAAAAQAAALAAVAAAATSSTTTSSNAAAAASGNPLLQNSGAPGGTNSASALAAPAATAVTAASDTLWLSRIINGLFVPIQAKDTFEGFYKAYLAKRLLWNRVVSMDIEKMVCSLLKTECGAGYTSKMEGMFQDIDWSRETMMVYKQSRAGALTVNTFDVASGSTGSDNISDSVSSSGGGAGAGDSVEMEVQVLTTGYWPVYKNWDHLILPDSLTVPQDRFSNHYKTKYQGRRMTWQYALGHCVVRANGFNKPYDFVVSLCQALVLCQFKDDSTQLSIRQLMNAIGFTTSTTNNSGTTTTNNSSSSSSSNTKSSNGDRDEMERILQSLAVAKDGTRILRKIDFETTAAGGTAASTVAKKLRSIVDDRDLFTVNTCFESNQRRIRIQNIMMKETKEEREKTTEAVSRDRLYLIDAVLVRIMKARKTISHQALIAQVMEQVKVPAQAADIKKRIESLIEREYMERDSRDRNRYNYLA